MVMVIVSIAFIFILVATLFWVTMSNFMMKYTDAKAKENFYSAETVLEEIKAGLQKEASDALYTTYNGSLSDYIDGSGEDHFQKQYLTNVYKYYKSASYADQFDIDKLTQYVDSGLYPGTASGYETKIEADGGTYKIVLTDKKVVLENVVVKFVNHKNGDYSQIRTDFVIGLPNVSFTKTEALPDIFDYALIANDDLLVKNGTAADVNKSIYGGRYGISVGEGKTGTAAAATLDTTDAPFVITDTSVSLNGFSYPDNRSRFLTGGNTRLYAKDIDIDTGAADLGGRSYVQDDLIFAGNNGTATISGDYFGYGNSLNDASQSSAILINGKDSHLDISGVDRMMLAGHAYVGTDRLEGVKAGTVSQGDTSLSNNGDIRMDQSIAVKGDQVAYLIPGDCIGVWRYANGTDGDTLVGMNPVPGMKVRIDAASGGVVPDFSEFVPASYDTSNGSVTAVDFQRSNYSLGGKSLSYYSNEYRTISIPQNGENMTYFYLVMSEEKAKEYISDYYGVEKGTLDRYYDFYTGGKAIKDPTGAGCEVTTAGHYLADVSGNALALTGASSNSAAFSSTFSDFTAEFRSRCAKLVGADATLSNSVLSDTVFNNVIHADQIKTGEVWYKVGGDETKFNDVSDSSEITALITSGDYEYGTHTYDSRLRLIISLGDVTVKKDFTGLIIARGRIILDGGSIILDGGSINVSGNKDDLARILQATIVKDSLGIKTVTKRPIDYFVDGSSYVLDGTSISGNGAVSGNEVIDFGNVVTYANWAKQ